MRSTFGIHSGFVLGRRDHCIDIDVVSGRRFGRANSFLRAMGFPFRLHLRK